MLQFALVVYMLHVIIFQLKRNTWFVFPLEMLCVTLHGLVDQYNSTLSRLLDEYAPLQTKTQPNMPDAPWINTAILEARKVWRQIEHHRRSTRLTVDSDPFKEQR